LILPIAIYGSESWILKTEDSNRLLVLENDCLRSLIGKRRRDRCRIKDLTTKPKAKHFGQNTKETAIMVWTRSQAW